MEPSTWSGWPRRLGQYLGLIYRDGPTPPARRTVVQRQRSLRASGTISAAAFVTIAVMVLNGKPSGVSRWFAILVLVAGGLATACMWLVSFLIARPDADEPRRKGGSGSTNY
jgi:hypothetical protein